MTAARRFRWPEAADALEELMATFALRNDGHGALVAETATGATGVRFVPPVVRPLRPGATPDDYLAFARKPLGIQALLLLQAGAAALGVWSDDTLVAHRAIKKYVIRGSGRAQPTHLGQKGKSRYGSRLRLQNAHRLRAEINELLADWEASEGPFDRILYACPVRTWAALLSTRPAPPFERDDERLTRVPFHVHVPDHAELLRVRRLCCAGSVES